MPGPPPAAGGAEHQCDPLQHPWCAPPRHRGREAMLPAGWVAAAGNRWVALMPGRVPLAGSWVRGAEAASVPEHPPRPLVVALPASLGEWPAFAVTLERHPVHQTFGIQWQPVVDPQRGAFLRVRATRSWCSDRRVVPGLLALTEEGALLTENELPRFARRRQVNLRLVAIPAAAEDLAVANQLPEASVAPASVDGEAEGSVGGEAAEAADEDEDELLPHASLASLAGGGHRVRLPRSSRPAARPSEAAEKSRSAANEADGFIPPPAERRVYPEFRRRRDAPAQARTPLAYVVGRGPVSGRAYWLPYRRFPRSAFANWRAALDAALAYEAEAVAALPLDDPRRTVRRSSLDVAGAAARAARRQLPEVPRRERKRQQAALPTLHRQPTGTAPSATAVGTSAGDAASPSGAGAGAALVSRGKRKRAPTSAERRVRARVTAIGAAAGTAVGNATASTKRGASLLGKEAWTAGRRSTESGRDRSRSGSSGNRASGRGSRARTSRAASSATPNRRAGPATGRPPE
jgi:hypothetical protein